MKIDFEKKSEATKKHEKKSRGQRVQNLKQWEVKPAAFQKYLSRRAKNKKIVMNTGFGINVVLFIEWPVKILFFLVLCFQFK